jgi:uncharacterized repeat protein (TIGR01451 family)
MRQFIAVLLVLFLFSVTQQQVLAQTPTCVPIFGGGATCARDASVVVNKQIKDPKSGKYVDSLTTPYAPGQAITFHIFVTNTTTNTVNGISIKDTFPTYLSYAAGDGKFDFSNQTFTANVTSLTKGQSKAISVTVTVVSADKIPGSPSPLCISNVVTATQNGKTSTDTTPFCLTRTAPAQTAQSGTLGSSTRNVQPGATTKGGLPVYSQVAGTKKTPATGPEDMAYAALAIAGAGGWYMRRKTTGRFSAE